MRVLIATHAPLEAELGAPQIARELAGGLRRIGHDVELWSPGHALRGMRWWRKHQWIRRRLENDLKELGLFDVVDVPAITLSAGVARHGFSVARSVQPEGRYGRIQIGELWRRRTGGLHLLAGLAGFVYTELLIRAGFLRAARVLCLGSLETADMAKSHPRLRRKLRTYVVAPPASERVALADVAQRRLQMPDRVRWLWIGRWVAHKGPQLLLDFAKRRLSARAHDRLTIAGTGCEVKQLDALPAEVRARIEVMPSFPRHALPELLARHDAGLFTSVVEGWGLVLNEMLEAGLPVFATEAGGVPDLRPFFPRVLLGFPPPADLAQLPPAEQPTQAYRTFFDWDAIAERYLASLDLG